MNTVLWKDLRLQEGVAIASCWLSLSENWTYTSLLGLTSFGDVNKSGRSYVFQIYFAFTRLKYGSSIRGNWGEREKRRKKSPLAPKLRTHNLLHMSAFSRYSHTLKHKGHSITATGAVYSNTKGSEGLNRDPRINVVDRCGTD